MAIHAQRARRKALTTGAIAGAALAAFLGFTADPAAASYTATVKAGTLQITGDAASDRIALSATPTTLILDVGEDGTADFSFDRSTFTAVDVKAGGGDDEVRMDNSDTFLDEPVTIHGGAGDDRLIGGPRDDVLLGDGGDDFVDGNIGADAASLGGGHDTFQWDPGDGSDTVDGQGGNDTMDFNGSNAPENIDVSADGSHVRLFRNVAAITMDMNDLETLNVRTLGSIDNVTTGDLSGTGMKVVNVDLAAFGGGDDGSVDTVTANGTDAADKVNVGSDAGDIVVSGLAAQTRVAGSAPTDNVRVATLGGADKVTSGVGFAGPAQVHVDGGDGADTTTYQGSNGDDTISIARNVADEVATFTPTGGLVNVNATVEDLVVQGLGGADTINGSNGIALTHLTVDGGTGDDTLGGGDGDDTMIGGTGNDHVDGNRGNDQALLNSGDDTFQWDPGDGNDSVDGQGGNDTMDFNGSNAPENIDVSANGSHVRLTRNVAAITMDMNDLETLNVRTLGSIDNVTTGDLSGTGMKVVDVDLGAFGGGGDGAADTVIANGTDRRDVVQVTRSGADVLTTGLTPQLRIIASEAANDVLAINTLGGNDDVTVAPGVTDVITPIVDLGAGE